jgi:hypothetical protein
MDAATPSAVEPVEGWVSCPRCSRRARRGQPFCEQCGVRLFDEAAAGSAASAAPRRSATCTQCSAVVQIPEGERTATCPFCDTPYVAEGELTPERYVPEFVLPFALPRERAEERFRAWLARRRLFAPGDLAAKARLEAPRGVYVPFWSFSTRSDSRWAADIGEHWWSTETYTTVVNGKPVVRTRRVRHTEWYPLEAPFQQFHAHYLVSGSRGMPQEVADAIAPYPLAEMLRYAPHYLSGWLAEEYSLGREEADRVSREAFAADERRAIAAFLPGDEHRGLRADTAFHDTTEDLLFLPVWILAFRYRGRVWRYVLNGATGKEWAEAPVSAPRVVLAVLIGLALVAGIVLFVLAQRGR